MATQDTHGENLATWPELLLHTKEVTLRWYRALAMTTAVPSAPPRTALSVRSAFGPSFELLATTQAYLFRSHHAYYDLGRAWFAKLARSAPGDLRPAAVVRRRLGDESGITCTGLRWNWVAATRSAH